jgi:hypothetical protein
MRARHRTDRPLLQPLLTEIGDPKLQCVIRGVLDYLEVIETIKDWGDLRMTVQGMSQFVFQEVSKRLSDPPIPGSIRRDPWAHLLPEIQTW